MLANGFKIGNAEVESPKSIQTATAHDKSEHQMFQEISDTLTAMASEVNNKVPSPSL